jgi:alkanesulfonate monooxygenase SsuD/methylene tetrahydromethanopterin reductase-like flavin-dependent oxidoreductase (luciferase family)
LAITVGVTVRYPALAPEARADAAEADPPQADATEPDAPEADATPPRPGLSGTPEEVAAGLRAHADAGADHLIASLEPCTPDTLAAFARAVGRFRAG